jgi:hypothetical protein
MSARECFTEELTTRRMLQYVANVCAECYRDLKENEYAYYDMDRCCYLCKSCASKACEEREEETGSYEEEDGQGLF